MGKLSPTSSYMSDYESDESSVSSFSDTPTVGYESDESERRQSAATSTESDTRFYSPRAVTARNMSMMSGVTIVPEYLYGRCTVLYGKTHTRGRLSAPVQSFCLGPLFGSKAEIAQALELGSNPEAALRSVIYFE